MMIEIIPFNENHTTELTPLFPAEWDFDFTRFIKMHYQKPYFEGFTLTANRDNIGYGNLFIFNKTAWLGNIIVSEHYRRQGFGKLITNYLIERGYKNNIETLNLIATELGQPVYKKLGFKNEIFYEFYATRKENFNFKIDDSIIKANAADLNNISKFDREITGENRFDLLNILLSKTYVFKIEDEIKGFFIDDLEAGAILSNNNLAGIELLKLKLNRGNKKIAIPSTNSSARGFLKEIGFEKQFELPKMQLGKRYHWHPEFIFNRGAGYCG